MLAEDEAEATGEDEDVVSHHRNVGTNHDFVGAIGESGEGILLIEMEQNAALICNSIFQLL
jgi:hypothetical protein